MKQITHPDCPGCGHDVCICVEVAAFNKQRALERAAEKKAREIDELSYPDRMLAEKKKRDEFNKAHQEWEAKVAARMAKYDIEPEIVVKPLGQLAKPPLVCTGNNEYDTKCTCCDNWLPICSCVPKSIFKRSRKSITIGA